MTPNRRAWCWVTVGAATCAAIGVAAVEQRSWSWWLAGAITCAAIGAVTALHVERILR